MTRQEVLTPKEAARTLRKPMGKGLETSPWLRARHSCSATDSRGYSWASIIRSGPVGAGPSRGTCDNWKTRSHLPIGAPCKTCSATGDSVPGYIASVTHMAFVVRDWQSRLQRSVDGTNPCSTPAPERKGAGIAACSSPTNGAQHQHGDQIAPNGISAILLILLILPKIPEQTSGVRRRAMKTS
jgi:hypothetical protein